MNDERAPALPGELPAKPQPEPYSYGDDWQLSASDFKKMHGSPSDEAEAERERSYHRAAQAMLDAERDKPRLMNIDAIMTERSARGSKYRALGSHAARLAAHKAEFSDFRLE